MNSKKWLKCCHVFDFSEQPPISCPSWQAIYAKVEQTLPNPLPRPTSERPAANFNQAEPDPSHHSFAETMRKESLHPTFHVLTNAAYIFMIAIAALVLVGGIFFPQSWYQLFDRLSDFSHIHLHIH